jgi:hypothetical protein
MLGLIRMLVAVEMLALPAWAAAVMVRPGGSRQDGLDPRPVLARLFRAPAPVVLLAAVLIGLAAFAEGPAVGEVLRTQAVALGFLLLLSGLAVGLDRLAGPVAAQVLAMLLGWVIVGGIILVGPAADLAQGPLQSALIRFAVHANPLVVAERELGLDWLHQTLTYRLTPLGESFGYLVRDLSCWKTALGHVFVGSGLLVFGARRP